MVGQSSKRWWCSVDGCSMFKFIETDLWHGRSLEKSVTSTTAVVNIIIDCVITQCWWWWLAIGHAMCARAPSMHAWCIRGYVLPSIGLRWRHCTVFTRCQLTYPLWDNASARELNPYVCNNQPVSRPPCKAKAGWTSWHTFLQTRWRESCVATCAVRNIRFYFGQALHEPLEESFSNLL